MSDDIPRCVCGHVSAIHFRSLVDPTLRECVFNGCPCNEFEDDMEEETDPSQRAYEEVPESEVLARPHDPLLAEVEGLRRENERLVAERDRTREVVSAARRVAAGVVRWGHGHDWIAMGGDKELRTLTDALSGLTKVEEP